jgi:hypothetical protein
MYMNVILTQDRNRVMAVAALASCLIGPMVHAETFSNLEAVDSNGVSIWSGPLPTTLTGVILTDPNEMLDSTPNFIPWNSGAGAYQLGGQWQIFVQAVLPGDRGGAECWMAQNYGNLPWEPHDGSDHYSNTDWEANVFRVSHDPATGYAFRKGDLVTVTANGSLFYGGMQNINEEHSTDPSLHFTVSLLATNYGLPAPEVISLTSVMLTNDGSGNHFDIFDSSRAMGGEHYQGMRVRINGLSLVDTNGWNTDADWDSRHCTATDGQGRQIPLVHPLYDLGAAPTNRFDATGVFIQETGSGTDGTFGYKLFVQEIEASADPIVAIAMKPVITWPSSLANYRLLSADSVTSTNWTAVTNVPVIVNGQSTVILDPTTMQKFYRLQQVQ